MTMVPIILSANSVVHKTLQEDSETSRATSKGQQCLERTPRFVNFYVQQ